MIRVSFYFFRTFTRKKKHPSSISILLYLALGHVLEAFHCNNFFLGLGVVFYIQEDAVVVGVYAVAMSTVISFVLDMVQAYCDRALCLCIVLGISVCECAIKSIMLEVSLYFNLVALTLDALDLLVCRCLFCFIILSLYHCELLSIHLEVVCELSRIKEELGGLLCDSELCFVYVHIQVCE